jgi:metallo-beta-lactamase family protein
VLESTYGDRDHKPLADTLAELETIMKEVVARKGKVLVPAFAIGRTQQIMYHLAGLFRQGLVPPIPVYIDSPMALAATKIYGKFTALFDEEAKALVQTGQFRRDLETVHACLTTDDSRALNDIGGPCVIIAGAGMCNGGRILHHLKHNLWRSETVVLIVGFQSNGSLGRMLVDGQKTVTIDGEKIAVRAAVRTLGGFSAHAGQSDLVRWAETLAPSNPRVVLTHGEDKAREPLARLLQERFKLRVELPVLEAAIVLD